MRGLNVEQIAPWEQQHGLMERSAVDIVDPSVDQPRYEAMIEALRREGPVTYYPYEGDDFYEGFWIVTDNALVSTTLAQSGIYSSHGPAEVGGGIAIHDLRPKDHPMRALMIMQDDPEHSKQRGLVERHFRKVGIGRLTEFLNDTAHNLLAHAVEEGETDFVASVASPLPLAAIAEVLGIPEDERDAIYEQGSKIALIDSAKPELTEDQIRATLHVLDAAKHVRELVNQGELQNPVLTDLFKAVVRLSKGEIPTDEKFISSLQAQSFFVLLFLAGNETTRNSLSSGVMALANNPDQWQALKNDPGLIDTTADEIVRFATPIRYVRRTAMADTTIGDAAIRAGEKVVVSLTGANRDSKIFSKPFAFDTTRSADEVQNSLAFGHGTHFCLGRYLAKLEVKTVLEEMVTQVDTIEVIGEPERRDSTLINNIGKLPVRLTSV